MKQVLTSLETGGTGAVEIPVPRVGPGKLLIETSCSLVSPGTERMLVQFGKANLLQKARQQPDKVRQVLEKIKTDGLQATLESVSRKLDVPLPLGYSNVGKVIEVGPGVEGFSVGDRVVSNGHHAEVVCVPKNLCARIPPGVEDEHAVFTVLGAIALQGIRLVKPTLGEAVVVTGLGLVGLLTVQLLRAHGCRVLGLDVDASRLALAREFGAEVLNVGDGNDPVSAAEVFSRYRGVDAVLITATSRSNEIVHQAAQMCRKRGRIVLVGVTGLALSRDDFYKKELSFQVSASYGPGRYDPDYEEKGQDYPVGFVRWTQQRNFEAFLDMLAARNIDVAPLISHRFDIEEANRAYDEITSAGDALGIVLDYPGPTETGQQTILLGEARRHRARGEQPTVSFIGAGNYASGVLIPAFKKAGAGLISLASNAGVSGAHTGRKHGFRSTTTDSGSLFEDGEVDAIVIASRHDSHARYVQAALDTGKHVFVEKPLCLSIAELDAIKAAYQRQLENDDPRILMVGFNRRFSPHVQKIKQLLADDGAASAFVMTVNAGAIPEDHWTQDKSIGGGRIVGEACHFIDLLRYLAASTIVASEMTTMNSQSGDTASIQLEFANGSIGTIHYFANGSKSFPKERLEVFSAGRILQLDNFRKLRGYGWPGFSRYSTRGQDKGQSACVKRFVEAIRGGDAPIPIEELLEVSRVVVELAAADAS